MLELTIADRLHWKIVIGKDLPRLISMRPLKKSEIIFAKRMGMRRFYLSPLAETEAAEFFKAFDKLWNQVVKYFGSDHPFWRNVVSSKMQEWERSAAYLALVLFTLAQKVTKESQSIVIVCSSIEEEDLCEEWGKKMGWKVYRKSCKPLPSWFRHIIQELRNLKNFLCMFSVCLYKKWFSAAYDPQNYLKKFQILIVSLFYNSCFKNGEYLDPFFGNLHDIIRQNGKSTVYIAGPLGNFKESREKTKECRDVSVIVPYSIITWIELVTLAIRVFVRRIRLPRTDFCGCDFSKLIMWNARRFEDFFNLDSEVYYTAVGELCKRKHFTMLIQLYEGNVFERGSAQAFRKCSSGLIVGYSHAVVYPLNLKIRLTDNEKQIKPEPDILIATGPETKRLMVNIGNRKPFNIHCGCSLRNIPVLDNTKTSEGIRSDILVALDGVWGCVTVLDWLIEQAEIIKDYNIRLRGHPNVPIKKLLAQCIHKLPDNFHLSNNDLKTDLENSFCVIYRQTSVGLQALMNGVPAIHLNIDAPLSCDPIMGLEVSKWEVHTPEELSAALQEINSLRDKRKEEVISAARKYAKDYFAIPDDKNVMVFLRETNEYFQTDLYS